MTSVFEQAHIDEGVIRKLEKMQRSWFDKRVQYKDQIHNYSYLAQCVKCIYIMRQNDYEYYDDHTTHSSWQCCMEQFGTQSTLI